MLYGDILLIYVPLLGPASNMKSLADALIYKPPVPNVKDARGGSGRSAGNTTTAAKLKVIDWSADRRK